MELNYNQFVEIFKQHKEIKVEKVLSSKERQDFFRILQTQFINGKSFSPLHRNELEQMSLVYDRYFKYSRYENNFLMDYHIEPGFEAIFIRSNKKKTAML